MGYTSASTMKIETVRCSFSCTTKNVVVVDDTPVYWSDTSPEGPWEGNPPQAGEDVTVKGNWNMIYDIESSAAIEYRNVFVEGRLTFKPGGDGSKHYELKA